mmetsp:Transcript_26277/g.34170  ORF Transcript_26277/g.34170 Transcript_26277/m.34170 type:complete len:103 (+) Transcript_26277:648-956(+)
MTTSPVTSNPSTDLINEVANSLKFIPNSILNCPKLIICDGYKFRDKNKFRSGEITSEWVDAYIEYKKNLQVLTGQHHLLSLFKCLFIVFVFFSLPFSPYLPN